MTASDVMTRTAGHTRRTGRRPGFVLRDGRGWYRETTRGQAFAHEGVWAGFSAFPGGATTGWHHHGDYATYAYITDGSMTVEYGPDGTEVAHVATGDFVHIPAHLVHRESVPDEGGSGVVVRVGGVGPTVFNVDGPDPGHS